MKERQAWCCLQVKLCDPCLSALCVPWCKKVLYKYLSYSFPFLYYRHPRPHAAFYTEPVVANCVVFVRSAREAFGDQLGRPAERQSADVDAATEETARVLHRAAEDRPP